MFRQKKLKLIDKKNKSEYPAIDNVQILVAPWGNAQEIAEHVYNKIEIFQPEFVWVCLGAPNKMKWEICLEENVQA